MKNWSSASALATSTARPRPRRPARPHCWRSDATVPGKPTEIAQSSRPMSIPSSSASVAVTPSRSPSSRRCSISRRCAGRVSRAIGGEPQRGGRIDAVGGEAVDQLGCLPALREADRPRARRDQLGEESRCVRKSAAAQPELGIEERRIPEHDLALRTWSAVRLDHGGRPAGERRGKLARIGDRRGGEQELWIGSVGARQAAQTPQDVGHV